jgi:ligand-binding SRPBCC domain-containing protein
MKLCSDQRVAAPRERVFAFHTDPANLARLLEGWSGFELAAHAGHIRPGARVEVRQRVGPLWCDFSFEHFVLEPPRRFGERQVCGPFTRFEHVHEFEERDGATLIVDRVDFALPWRLGGRAAELAVAAPFLRRFFAFRAAAYGRLAAAGAFAPS